MPLPASVSLAVLEGNAKVVSPVLGVEVAGTIGDVFFLVSKVFRTLAVIFVVWDASAIPPTTSVFTLTSSLATFAFAMETLIVSPLTEALAPSDSLQAEPRTLELSASAATFTSGFSSETPALAATCSIQGVLLGPLLKAHL